MNVITIMSEINNHIKVHFSPDRLITRIEMGRFRESGIVWDYHVHGIDNMMSCLIEIHRDDPQIYPDVYDMCKDNQEGLMTVQEIEEYIFNEDMVEWDRKVDAATETLTELITARSEYTRLAKGRIPSLKGE